ncbi:hypothetical protein EU527_11785 [Candidatus Thorarchaeota archaeon]|nr:MAG: hypothetical protein EU527_11785 [Candidatus Thorarchaeota archaeon]
MNRKYRILVGTFLLIALIGTITFNASAMGTGTEKPGPGSPPEQERMSDGSIWISTDLISILANNEIPSFHFWYSADEDGSHAMFRTTYVMIVEFEDENDDLAYQKGEELYFAPLSSYEWTVTTGEIREAGQTTEVWLKYTKSGVRTPPMPNAPIPALEGPGYVNQFKDVTIQIWAHIYLNDYFGEVSDDEGVKANYTVYGGAELKMDIEIGNFPFSSETSRVALQTLQHESVATGDHTPQINTHRIQTRERFRNVSIDSTMNWTTEGGNESRFESRNGTHMQNIDFIDSTTGIVQGFFSWVDQAVITWPGGATEAVDVIVSYIPTGTGLAVYLAYPNFNGGSILHDPSIGLYSDGEPSTSEPVDLVLVIGIGVVALIAILLVLVRKK